MGHRGSALGNALVVLLSQYVARGVVLARGLAAAVALGPHGYGGWNALNLIFDYGSYASLGALQGLDLKLPGAVAGGDAARARGLMAGAWALVVLGGAAFAALLVIYLVSGGNAFSAWPGLRLPLLMLGAALLQLAFQYLAGALRAHERFRAVGAGQAVQAIVGCGLGIALVWSLGALGLVLGWILGTLMALEVMRRSIPEAPLAPLKITIGFDLARSGMPIFAYFTLSLVLRSLDRMALLRFGGEEPLGLYSLGLMIAGIILYLPEAGATVLFPRMAASADGARDPEETRAQTLVAQRLVARAVPVLASVGLVVAAPVVSAWLPEYGDGLPALRILAVGALCISAATLPGYALLASARSRTLVLGAAIATAMAALLIFAVAARRPEPAAVAVAATLGQALFALTVLGLFARGEFPGFGASARWVTAQLWPALAAGVAVQLVSAWGSDASWGHAALRALAMGALGAPLVLPLAREFVSSRARAIRP